MYRIAARPPNIHHMTPPLLGCNREQIRAGPLAHPPIRMTRTTLRQSPGAGEALVATRSAASSAASSAPSPSPTTGAYPRERLIVAPRRARRAVGRDQHVHLEVPHERRLTRTAP